jgi:hypothetical protein
MVIGSSKTGPGKWGQLSDARTTLATILFEVDAVQLIAPPIVNQTSVPSLIPRAIRGYAKECN